MARQGENEVQGLIEPQLIEIGPHQEIHQQFPPIQTVTTTQEALRLRVQQQRVLLQLELQEGLRAQNTNRKIQRSLIRIIFSN